MYKDTLTICSLVLSKWDLLTLLLTLILPCVSSEVNVHPTKHKKIRSTDHIPIQNNKCKNNIKYCIKKTKV